jgi:hypothetical protein
MCWVSVSGGCIFWSLPTDAPCVGNICLQFNLRYIAVHSVLRNGELVIVTELIYFFLICYIGVAIIGTAQDITLCPLITCTISSNFCYCGSAVLPGLCHLIVEVLGSHTVTSRSVGLLWTRDQLIADTSTDQHS